MPVVRLRGPLKRLAGDRVRARGRGRLGRRAAASSSSARIRRRAAGSSTSAACCAGTSTCSSTASVAAQDTQVARGRPGRRAAGDLGRMRAMTELLVGTKKGLFVLEGEPGSPFEVTAPGVRGRAGRVRAARPALRPRARLGDLAVLRAEDLVHRRPAAASGSRPTASRCPTGGDAALERIWVIVPGEDDGTVYAGGDPGVLFESRDGGATLRAQPRALGAPEPRRGGSRAPAGCACTRSPRGPASRTGWRSAISAAGVWLTDDGGETWRSGNEGIVARYLPEDVAGRRDRALRAPPPARADPAGAHVHAVPRRRLPLRRRRARRGRTSRPACRRTSASRSRSTPPTRQRVRHPAGRRRRPRHARRAACASTRRATPARAGRRAATGCRPRTRTSRCCARRSTGSARARRSSSTSARRREPSTARPTPGRAGSRWRRTCRRSTRSPLSALT